MGFKKVETTGAGAGEAKVGEPCRIVSAEPTEDGLLRIVVDPGTRRKRSSKSVTITTPRQSLGYGLSEGGGELTIQVSLGRQWAHKDEESLPVGTVFSLKDGTLKTAMMGD